jgi:hypothetical protein
MNTLAKMSDPASWPGRTLCLKRYLPKNQMEFADLMHHGDDRYQFIPLDYGSPQSGDKTLLEQLVLEGWVVD